MLSQGQPPSEVASTFKVSNRTVQRWMNKPEFQLGIEQAKAKAFEVIGEEVIFTCKQALVKGLPKAVRRIIEALDNPDPRVRLKACEVIGRWTGFHNPQSPQLTSQPEPEENLRRYLELVSRNGNGHLHS